MLICKFYISYAHKVYKHNSLTLIRTNVLISEMGRDAQINNPPSAPDHRVHLYLVLEKIVICETPMRLYCY